jgi:protoheme IX farnesyltransferase
MMNTIRMKNVRILSPSDCVQLCRPKIATFAAFSAGCSFIIADPQDVWEIIFVIIGVMLIASGASCLNQYQESATDALMARTKERPIPAGRVRPRNALYLAGALIITGVCILLAGCSPVTALLGLGAAGWYNCIYTYLKKKSAFAAVPGGITGAMIPAVGWAGAGGSLLDPRLAALSVFFALWQVPHFWLFVTRYGTEYEEAGLPALTAIFNPVQISRIIFVWIMATAVSALILCMYLSNQHIVIQYVILLASSWLVWQGTLLLTGHVEAHRLIFMKINGYVSIIMFLLCFA